MNKYLVFFAIFLVVAIYVAQADDSQTFNKQVEEAVKKAQAEIAKAYESAKSSDFSKQFQENIESLKKQAQEVFEKLTTAEAKP